MAPSKKKFKVNGYRRSVRLMEKAFRKNPIEHVNDDCLLQVFSYLNLKDWIACEQVSTQFRNLITSTYHKYKVLDLVKEEWSTLAMAKIICAKIGPYVQTLRADYSEKLPPSDFTPLILIEIFGKCHNLQHIWINDINLDSDVYSALRILCERKQENNFDPIKSIKMISCGVSDLCDSFIDFIQKGHIESYDLSCNERITGRCLSFLNNVKNVNLNLCKIIERNHFIDFCGRNTTLATLRIMGSSNWDQSCINIIAEKLLNLTELALHCHELMDIDDVSVLADLPKLVRLEFLSCSRLGVPLFQRLAHHNRLKELCWKFYSLAKVLNVDELGIPEIFSCSMKIRSLTTYANCRDDEFSDVHLREATMENLQKMHISHTSVTNEGIYHFILAHPSLDYVDLSYCKHITDTFAELIIPHLQDDFKNLLIDTTGTNMSKNHQNILFMLK